VQLNSRAVRNMLNMLNMLKLVQQPLPKAIAAAQPSRQEKCVVPTITP